MRSRVVMAIVLATTAMMMRITTKETIWMAVTIAPLMAMNPWLKAFSVSVSVSAREFLKYLSTARATSGATSGLATAIM